MLQELPVQAGQDVRGEGGAPVGYWLAELSGWITRSCATSVGGGRVAHGCNVEEGSP